MSLTKSWIKILGYRTLESLQFNKRGNKNCHNKRNPCQSLGDQNRKRFRNTKKGLSCLAHA